MSQIQGHYVVDDTFKTPDGGAGEYGTGYDPRDYASYPICGLKCARPYSGPRLSKQEIQERIAEKTANKTWIRDQCDRVGSKVKNQSRSSYCWIHAPTRGMECKRVAMGNKFDPLAAFYAGSMIKNGWDQGGSGIVGVEWLATHGTCLESMWEPMKFRGINTPEIIANAAKHQILIWEDMDAGDHDAIASSVIFDDPVTVGIPAWGHEVLITYLVWNAGTYTFGIDNSWSPDWGDNGRGLLTGRYSRFDEAGRIGSMEASED
jgi:hypothetical protein